LKLIRLLHLKGYHYVLKKVLFLQPLKIKTEKLQMFKKQFVCLLMLSLFMTVIPVFAQQPIKINDRKEKTIKQKEQKSGNRKFKKYKTKEAKYEAAKAYYNKGAYLTASQLLEEIYPLYISSPQGDSILFLFANSYYKNNDFLIAAFYFNDYLKKYPQSPRSEEAAFLRSKAYFLNSPNYNLDQTDSYLALNNLELFVNYYPQSQYINEVNNMMDSIRNKLAKKDFAIASMYYRTEKYKSAQVAFQNLLRDYPESPYVEQAMLLWIKNNYEYAMKSVETKKVERFQSVIDIKNKLHAKYPQSAFLPDADKLAADAEKRITKLLEENK